MRNADSCSTVERARCTWRASALSSRSLRLCAAKDLGTKHRRCHFSLEDEMNGAFAVDRAEHMSVGKYCRFDVCELFSPPRVAARAHKAGLRGGWSLDLRAPDPISGRHWDLSDPMEQQRIIDMIRRDKPTFVIGSPPCTIFSQLQHLNPNWDSDDFYEPHPALAHEN